MIYATWKLTIILRNICAYNYILSAIEVREIVKERLDENVRTVTGKMGEHMLCGTYRKS